MKRLFIYIFTACLIAGGISVFAGTDRSFSENENRYLTKEKKKRQDPDYVETYARGKYQLSKDGEQIFYLPENTEK